MALFLFELRISAIKKQLVAVQVDG